LSFAEPVQGIARGLLGYATPRRLLVACLGWLNVKAPNCLGAWGGQQTRLVVVFRRINWRQVPDP